MKTTSERIRYYRKKAGLTQDQLAHKLGITQGTITQYENGRRTPKFETLQKIANAIGCDLFDLIPMEEAPEGVSDPSFNENDTEENELLRRLRAAVNGSAESDDLHSLARWMISYIENEQRIRGRSFPIPSSVQKNRLQTLIERLNAEGLQKLVEYAEDLLKIQGYRTE